MNRFTSPDDFIGSQQPGPCSYNPEKPQKHPMCMNFYNKPEIARSLNMLTKWTKYAQSENTTFSRPITVNVYFKSENPPPGYYDIVDRPKTQSFAAGHNHLFKSKCTREEKIKNDIPDMGAYDPEINNFDFQPSAVFVGPTEKKKVKINLYDPHQDLPKNISPGPGEYLGIKKDDQNTSTSTHFPSNPNIQKRAKTTNFRKRAKIGKNKYCLSRIPETIGYESSKPTQAFTNTFQVSNFDRFGEPIEKMAPIDLKPSPGAYNSSVIPKRKIVSYSMGKIVRATGKKTKFKAPGPAYYKPSLEPKANSYHLNVQNKWMC
mmetsp:Transcript_8099/g.7174  ORF Transcript_8099/g.7174 Transcript_8099/m.7174 type:complete len:318 (+) Transcript_8099:345-1298(+)